MPLGIAVIILSKVVQYGIGGAVVPTPQPYIAADYYSYNVGLEGTIKNRPPAHSGPIKWKEKWSPF